MAEHCGLREKGRNNLISLARRTPSGSRKLIRRNWKIAWHRVFARFGHWDQFQGFRTNNFGGKNAWCRASWSARSSSAASTASSGLFLLLPFEPGSPSADTPTCPAQPLIGSAELTNPRASPSSPMIPQTLPLHETLSSTPNALASISSRTRKPLIRMSCCPSFNSSLIDSSASLKRCVEGS